MGTLNIDNAVASDYSNTITDDTIPQMSTEGATDTKETRYSNPNFTKYWGIFNAVSDVQSGLLMKGTWDVGKGYTTDKGTQPILDKITGWGKESFDEILFNMDVMRFVAGDSYAEVVRNDNGTLVNLKCLDPASITHVVSDKGMLLYYEQTSKVSFLKVFKRKAHRRIELNEMFHLTSNRLADQIHGISKIAAVERNVTAQNQNTLDVNQLMHHQVRPFLIFKWKTDDESKIAEMKGRIDKLRDTGDDLHLPDDEDVLTIQEVKINMSDIIFTWRNDTRNEFYRHFGLPLVIFGSGGSTESGGKMEMFAHETVFQSDQRYLERQLWAQLAIKIKLNSPVGLSQNLLSDEAKDASQGQEVQPQDTAPVGEVSV